MNEHMIRILHAADFHLDSPFENLTADKAAQRRSEQRQLLRRLTQVAAEKQVQLVLLSGDLFDSATSFRQTQDELRDALRSLQVPVFIAPGNHDCVLPGSPYLTMAWPENVYIFTEHSLQCVPLPELGVRVWGAAFTDIESESLMEGFEAVKQPDTLDVMVMHGQVGQPNSRYNPVRKEDILHSGMDYIAFGHIHGESGLLREGETWYAWPGCPEGRGFDETGEKYVYYLELTETDCRLEKRSIAQRHYRILSIDLSDGQDLEQKLPPKEETCRDIYRLILRGETSDPLDIQALYRTLEDRFYALEIRDTTRARKDLWQGADQDTLRGLFLQKLRQQYEEAESEEEMKRIRSAAEWGIAALDNREVTADDYT
jgi:exonuclease SbcD